MNYENRNSLLEWIGDLFNNYFCDKYSYYVREYGICTGGNDKKPEGEYVR